MHASLASDLTNVLIEITLYMFKVIIKILCNYIEIIYLDTFLRSINFKSLIYRLMIFYSYLRAINVFDTVRRSLTFMLAIILPFIKV